MTDGAKSSRCLTWVPSHHVVGSYTAILCGRNDAVFSPSGKKVDQKQPSPSVVMNTQSRKLPFELPLSSRFRNPEACRRKTPRHSRELAPRIHIAASECVPTTARLCLVFKNAAVKALVPYE